MEVKVNRSWLLNAWLMDFDSIFAHLELIYA